MSPIVRRKIVRFRLRKLGFGFVLWKCAANLQHIGTHLPDYFPWPASSLRLGLISTTLADGVVVNKPKVSSDLYCYNLYNFDIWDVILILDMINAVLSPFGPPLCKKWNKLFIIYNSPKKCWWCRKLQIDCCAFSWPLYHTTSYN